MLDKDIPADYDTIYYMDMPLRIHKHSDNGSIWCVGKDLCDILHLTNVSYIASKIDSSHVIRHCILNCKGKQTVTWFDIEAVQLLTLKTNKDTGAKFFSWYLTSLDTDYISIPKEYIIKLINLIQDLKKFLHIFKNLY